MFQFDIIHYFNFRCVLKDKCDRTDHVTTRLREYLTQQGLADFAKCSDEGQICCHIEEIIPDNECSSYADYTCTERTNCLDAFIASSDEGSGLDLRGFDDSNPALATCPTDGHSKFIIY